MFFIQQIANRKLERWPRGLKRPIANVLYLLRYRGFESRFFRSIFYLYYLFCVNFHVNIQSENSD